MITRKNSRFKGNFPERKNLDNIGQLTLGKGRKSGDFDSVVIGSDLFPVRYIYSSKVPPDP